jgi:hypothetical protein
MLLKTALFAFLSARLVNIPISENNFIDFSDYEYLIENPTNFNFAVFTDAQFGKYDKEDNNGDGTNVAYDVARIEEMCRQISEMTELERPAFIMNLGDIAHALPHDEGANNPGSNPELRPFQVAEYLDAMRACPQETVEKIILKSQLQTYDGCLSTKEIYRLRDQKPSYFSGGNEPKRRYI